MAITRIEAVTYGVEDLAACTRFFADAGLEPVHTDDRGALFRTPVNQFVELRHSDDPSLSPAIHAGSGIREIIWGVDGPEGLEVIRRELSTDRPVTASADGILHSRDDIGYAIGFKVAEVQPPPESIRDYNGPARLDRVNRPLVAHGRPRPVRLIHVALDAPAADHERHNEFYLRRLRFKAVDDSRPVGVFMQCEGDLMHHNLLLVHRSDGLGTNHMAMEMSDFDAVIEAGNHMTEKGWKESRRLGRHTLGSNAPCGGRIEFAYDMDRMDKNWKTRVWEKAPPHHLWMVKFPGDAGQRSGGGGD